MESRPLLLVQSLTGADTNCASGPRGPKPSCGTCSKGTRQAAHWVTEVEKVRQGERCCDGPRPIGSEKPDALYRECAGRVALKWEDEA
jgi:hypothetical protein